MSDDPKAPELPLLPAIWSRDTLYGWCSTCISLDRAPLLAKLAEQEEELSQTQSDRQREHDKRVAAEGTIEDLRAEQADYLKAVTVYVCTIEEAKGTITDLRAQLEEARKPVVWMHFSSFERREPIRPIISWEHHEHWADEHRIPLCRGIP